MGLRKSLADFPYIETKMIWGALSTHSRFGVLCGCAFIADNDVHALQLCSYN
jgi:hypothetical protein